MAKVKSVKPTDKPDFVQLQAFAGLQK